MQNTIPEVIEALEQRNDVVIVSDDDNGRAGFLGHLLQEFHYRQSPLAVQGRSRFIGQNHRGIVGQRPRYRNALLFASGQLLDSRVCPMLYIE